MDNPFDEMRRAMNHANDVQRSADRVASSMADMLRGRLCKVDSASTLAALKKELRNFNAHTGRWS